MYFFKVFLGDDKSLANTAR